MDHPTFPQAAALAGALPGPTGATGAAGATGATGAAGAGSTIRHAAGVPTGAPTGTEAPVAFDSTASTGGLYVWTGAAWVKGSTIP